MRDLNLNNTNLNLLVAFEALVIEGHVSRAAARIGVSQPAMSRSLRQLREIFGDTLFRRTSSGMEPTPKALELARELRPGLDAIAAAVGRKVRFDPQTSERRYVVSMPDMAAHLALPRLLQMLRVEAPGVDLTVHGFGNAEAVRKIETGEIELAWGVFEHLPNSIASANVLQIREVCIADPGNPALRAGRLSLDEFMRLPHAVVAMNEDHGTPIDTVLETMGLRRRIALRIPHFLPIARSILGTDLVAVIAEPLLDSLPESKAVARFEIPVPIEPVMAKLIWHKRSDADKGLQWFIAKAVRTQDR